MMRENCRSDQPINEQLRYQVLMKAQLNSSRDRLPNHAAAAIFGVGTAEDGDHLPSPRLAQAEVEPSRSDSRPNQIGGYNACDACVPMRRSPRRRRVTLPCPGASAGQDHWTGQVHPSSVVCDDQ
jgi:hypothetical protein